MIRWLLTSMTVTVAAPVAERCGRLIDDLVPGIRKTAELVQPVSTASQEQSAGRVQVSKAMGVVEQVTQRDATAAEELSSTAEEMSAQAEALLGLVSSFQTAARRPSAPPAPLCESLRAAMHDAG